MLTLPPRQPIQDSFSGVLLRHQDDFLLSTHPQPNAETIQAGLFTVRYGVVFLGRSQQAIVPDLLVLDYGEALNGENAWDFLLNKSNLYPRGDVLGYDNTGKDDMVTVKSLDLMQPFRVFAFEQPDSHLPLALIRAIITAHPELLAERLLAYTPTFPTLADWLKAQ